MSGDSNNPLPSPAGVPGSIDTIPATEIRSADTFNMRDDKVDVPRLRMSDLEAAGIDLLKLTLLIIGVGALVLIIATIVSDRLLPPPQAAAAADTMGPSPARLRDLAEAFNRAASGAPWPPAQAEAAAAVLQSLRQGDLLSDAESATLEPCEGAIAATTADRADVLRLCAATLEETRDELLVRRQTAETRAQDAQKDYNERRDANHTFWFQVTQVLLATVLAPIATTLVTNLFVQRAQQARGGQD